MRGEPLTISDERYSIDGFSAIDPVQGYVLYDCSLIAALSSIAWACPKNLDNRLSTVDHMSVYRTFKFFNAKTDRWNKVTIDEKVPDFITSSYQPQESWPSLIEKAYVKWVTGLKNDDELTEDIYNETFPVDPLGAMQSITGHIPIRQTTDGHKPNELLEMILKDSCSQEELNRFINQGGVNPDFNQIGNQPYFDIPVQPVKYPMIAFSRWFSKKLPQSNFTAENILPKHAYSIIGVAPGGFILLRDPRGGRGEPPQSVRDYLKNNNYFEWRMDNSTKNKMIKGEFTFQKTRVVWFPIQQEDGIFPISADAFLRFFEGFGFVLDTDEPSKLTIFRHSLSLQ